MGNIDIIELVLAGALGYAGYSANDKAKTLSYESKSKVQMASIIAMVAAGYLLIVASTDGPHGALDPLGEASQSGGALSNISAIEVIMVAALGYAGYVLISSKVGTSTEGYIILGVAAYLLYEAWTGNTTTLF
jgi:hypothetical protein